MRRNEDVIHIMEECSRNEQILLLRINHLQVTVKLIYVKQVRIAEMRIMRRWIRGNDRRLVWMNL